MKGEFKNKFYTWVEHDAVDGTEMTLDARELLVVENLEWNW